MNRVLCAPGAAENPYQARLARALEAHGFELRLHPLSWRVERELLPGERLLHLHWLAPLLSDPRGPRTALKLGLFARGLRRLGKRGIPFVWTVHNLYEHERQHLGLERRLRRWLARHAAALIVHGPSAAERVRREYRVPERTEVAIVPHGNYIGVYPEGSTRSEARRHLGLDPEAPTLLFLGQIRQYKGVVDLIAAVARIRSGLQLVIAGRPHPPSVGDELRARAQDVEGLHLQLEFVPDEEVATYVAACDLFVLPHKESLTSGSAILAMSLGRACLAPRSGCFEELLGEEGGFLFDPAATDGLESTLRHALTQRSHWDRMGLRNRAALEPVGWERVAAETAAVYARALRSPAPA